jgi:hypothetical protein
VRRLAVTVCTLLALLAVLCAGNSGAFGAWSATASGPARVAAGTMGNASALNAACTDTSPASSVTLTWVPAPDPYVTGYEIVRTALGAGTAHTISVAGRATARYTDAVTDAPGAYRAYSYTIRAVSTTTKWTTAAVAGTGLPGYTHRRCWTHWPGAGTAGQSPDPGDRDDLDEEQGREAGRAEVRGER